MFGLKKTDPERILLLDGPMRPNDLLETADARPLERPEDMCVAPDGALLVASGRAVLRLRDWGAGAFEPVAEFDADVGALACRADGLVAVGLRGAGLRVLTAGGGAAPGWATLEDAARDIRACLFRRDGSLAVADAGEGDRLQDLFRPTGGGRVLGLDADGGCETIAAGLRFPHGLAETGAGGLVISESWAARLCAATGAGLDPVLRDAPGYPARIAPVAGGGYVLSCFARRDPLIEFLLTEPAFLARMTREVDPEHWIAPRLAADRDHRIPTQLGAARLFGETKPWAPSPSYGLVVRLDADFIPVTSAQSRADGRRHGIVAALEWRGDLIALSKGAGLLLNVTAMARWT